MKLSSMYNKRTSLLLALGVVATTFWSCDDKETLPDNDFAYVSITHAAPIKPTGVPVNTYVDGQRINLGAIIAYPATVTGTYVGLKEGTHSLAVKDTGTAPVNEYLSQDVQVERRKSYAAFVYDTLNAGKLKLLVVPTDRTDAASGTVNVRFLHLSPNAPAVDLWGFRSATDSVRLASNVTYVGNNAGADYSAFTNIPSGSLTALRVRAAGTNTNIASITSATGLISSKVYTYYFRGLTGSTGALAPGISVLTHN